MGGGGGGDSDGNRDEDVGVDGISTKVLQSNTLGNSVERTLACNLYQHPLMRGPVKGFTAYLPSKRHRQQTKAPFNAPKTWYAVSSLMAGQASHVEPDGCKPATAGYAVGRKPLRCLLVAGRSRKGWGSHFANCMANWGGAGGSTKKT